MKFKNSLNKTNSHLLLAGIFSLTLSACSSGGDGAAPVGGGTGGSAQIVSSIDLPDDGSGVHVAGNYAYVAADSSGLQVINVSDKASPTIVAESVFSRATGGIAYMDLISGNFIFASGGIGGHHEIDVTIPTSPAYIDNSDGVTGNNTFDINASATNVLCSAEGPAGVRIRSQVGNSVVATTLQTVGVAISGDYCFAIAYDFNSLSGDTALYVIDVSDPDNATLEPTAITLGGTPGGISIAGNYAYVTAGDPGMYVIDISIPTAPVIAGQTDPLPTTGPIAVDATRMRAYLGTVDTVGFSEEGLKVIDITNAASPAVIATADLPDQTAGVFALDGNVYATTSAVFGTTATSQFHIVDVSAF